MSFEEVMHNSCSTVSQAARYGNLDQMKRLISEGHPTDAYDNRGWRAVHEAAYGNYPDCISSLLEIEGTDVNWQAYDGVTALFLACQCTHLNSIKVLLSAKADPNVADHTDHYPLHEAVKSKNLELCALLMDNGAKVDCQNYCGTSPLHTSVAEGISQITDYLIKHGASLDIKEEYNITPIFTAAHFGQAECLQLLLSAARQTGKVNLVNYPADDGATPLFLAAQEGHLKCVQLLLEAGADANIMTNTEPRSLPVQAAMEFGHVKIAEELLPRTELAYFKDCDCSPWYTVLTQATASVKRQLVKLMVSHGVDVNYRHTKDMEELYTRFPKILRFVPTEAMLFLKCITPLTMSTIFEPGKVKSPILSMLLENGAHVNGQRLYEFPPLIPAVERGKNELVRSLIAAGANVNLYHPKLQGNYAVLLCMHLWKSFSLLLRVGADVETMFNEAKYLRRVEETIKSFTSLQESGKSETAENTEIKSDTMCGAKCDNAHSPSHTKVFAQSNSNTQQQDSSTAEHNTESDQIQILERNSYLPFRVFLVSARRVICGSPFNVNLGSALHRMLYFCSNVSVEEELWSFFDSQQEVTEARKLTDSPRPLSHLCRLSIRQRLGSVRLLSEDHTRTQLHLPRNIWDYIFFSEVED